MQTLNQTHARLLLRLSKGLIDQLETATTTIDEVKNIALNGTHKPSNIWGGYIAMAKKNYLDLLSTYDKLYPVANNIREDMIL
jgi:hypothetical protein